MSLKDLKIQAFTEPVSDLPDNPSQSGITAEELKRRFDANANNELKPSVNGIVDFLLGFTNGEEIKGIRLNEDNVVEVTKDGANYISTGYSKAYITQMLAEKVDKADVLLKTNTEEFTPTGIYQPATKKYVDDKVLSAGAADMTQAVYDPTGRQTDIFAEIDKKANNDEHQLKSYYGLNGLGLSNDDFNATDFTATVSTILNIMPNGSLFAIACSTNTAPNLISCISNKIESDLGITYGIVQATVIVKKWNNTAMPSEIEVIYDSNHKKYECVCETDSGTMVVSKFAEAFNPDGYLPLTGGDLTGDLTISRATPAVKLKDTNINRTLSAFVGSDGKIYFRNFVDANNRTAFLLEPETGSDLTKLFRLQKMVEGEPNVYNVYGEHNKPSGSYAGISSSGERIVSVGGAGDVLLVRRGRACYFISADGYYSANTNYTTATFVDGVLTIKSNDNILDNDGVTYYYTVL